jgi:hypothetical protein
MGAKCVILVTKTICYVWLGIQCSDIDNEQKVKKAIKAFLRAKNGAYNYLNLNKLELSTNTNHQF